MIQGFCALFTAALLAGMAAPAFAAEPAATPPAASQAAPQASASLDPNEVICERQTVVGTRLGKKKVCMTRAQWADTRLQDRQEVERVQVQRGAKGE